MEPIPACDVRSEKMYRRSVRAYIFCYVLGIECAASMITTVSTWRCKCDTRIKVVSETPKDNPLATSMAECPKCGDQQVIYGVRILSITVEQEETAH